MWEGEKVGTDTTTGYYGQRWLFTTANVTSLAMRSMTIPPLENVITPSTTHLSTLPDMILKLKLQMNKYL